jgi:hypothetical protein
MKRRPFDLTFLRRGARRTDPVPEPGLTRREAIAGVAAAAVVPAVLSSFAEGPGVIAVTSTPGRAAFTIDGREVWTVDASRYAGRPRVAVTRTGREITVSLTGALYPGTVLPADVTIVSYDGVTGPRLHVSLALGGFEAEVPARAWLRGRASANARVSFAAPGLGQPRWTLALGGNGDATYTAAGVFSASGSAIASLGGLTGGALRADALEVRLLEPAAPSSLVRPPARRTLITLARGAQHWAGAPRVAASHPGSLAWEKDAFDIVDIEAAQSAAGSRCVAVARSLSDTTALTYTTPVPAGSGLLGLALASPRLAVSYDSGEKASALVADFAAPSWFSLKGLSVRVGPAAGAPPFEATGTGHRLTQVTCSPAITGAVPATSDGTIVEAVLRDGKATRLASLGDVRVPAGVRKAATVSVADLPFLPALDLVIVRPDDLLVMTLRFENLYVDASGEVAVLRPVTPNAPSYLIAELPPQHVLERAFYQTRPDSGAKITNTAANGTPLPAAPGSETPFARPVNALLSGGSRLAFKVPAQIDPIRFRLQDLLRFDRLEPSIVDAARVFEEGSGTPISAPASVGPAADNQTAIEFPTRLQLSPDESATWLNATAPVTAADPLGGVARWSELWHTVAVPAHLPWRAGHPTPLRAVYSPDYSTGTAPTHSNSPFRASLDRRDRHELVKIMGRYRFDPASARLFALSALGGWMDLKATWDPTAYTAFGASMSDVEVEAWEHRATQGRDHYVKVVYSGYLFPFGHRASLIKVTERQNRFDFSSPADPNTAYLIQRMYVVVREPERLYGDPPATPRARYVPFRSVRIETVRTPDLDNIGTGIGSKGQQCFWPTVGGTEFAFRMTATDRAGKPVEFTAPLIFVSRERALYPVGSPLTAIGRHDYLLKVLADYRDPAHPLRRGRVFGGQPIAFAPESGSKPGDTTLETTAIAFTAEIFPASETSDPSAPRFSPRLDFATVRLPAVGEITGGRPSAFVRYPGVYLNNGLADSGDANTGDVFVELLPAAQVPVPFGGDRAGGLATPSFTVSALSRTYGTVAGPVAAFAAGDFQPSDFFDPSARLLGGMSLADVVNPAPAFKTVGGAPDAEVPRMKQYVEGDEQVVSYEWSTRALKEVAVFVPMTAPDPPASLELRAEARRKLPPATGEPTVSVSGTLYNFRIDLVKPLVSFIRVAFDSVSFQSLQGATPTVSVNIHPGGVEFDGPLTFLSAFTPFISFGGGTAALGDGTASAGHLAPASLGGGSGSDISIDASGVTLKYTLGIPTIAVGICSIQDIAFSAGIRLPFDGSPVRLRLAFSERDKPFLVGVLIFAGGGFFAIALGADSIESLEATLEFGGQLSLSLGVASGAVYARGGIYFGLKWVTGGEELTFAAFLRYGGALEVLGLITVSMEFYMALNFKKVSVGGADKVKLWGEATLTVEVEVLCFSKSVDLTVTRELAGSDPGFVDMFPESVTDHGTSKVWDDYCAAFEPALLS